LNEVRLSVIIPTPDGRDIGPLYESLKGQLEPGDEVLLVLDTTTNEPAEIIRQAHQETNFQLTTDEFWKACHVSPPWGHDNGHEQINVAMGWAQGTHLVFNDDDDTFTPGALAEIRKRTQELQEPAVQLYQFTSPRNGGVLWKSPSWPLGVGAIGGHCIVPPNVPEKLGRWSRAYEGDHTFIAETIEKWLPVQPVFQEFVIASAR